MFFRDTDRGVADLNGRRYPQPPLLWAVSENTLRVRALAQDQRPTAATKLFVAPYYNTDGETGVVCQGSMRSPEERGVAAIGQWELAFFQSAFTHQTGVQRLTSHPPDRSRSASSADNPARCQEIPGWMIVAAR